MGITNIVNGHLNELLGNNEVMKDSFMGYVCSSKLWLNPKTGDISTERKDGYKRGCGCRLNAKVRDIKSSCPACKW